MLQDVLFALRLFRRQPGFTVMACLTLALGIGATTAVLAIAYALFRPLPYPESDRLVRVASTNRAGIPSAVSPLDFLDYRSRIPSLESAVAWRLVRRNLSGGNEPERLIGAAVSAEFFAVARTVPALGHPFTSEDFVTGDENAVILSHGLWRRRFGGDPGAINRPIQLNARPATIVGVMPEDFALPAEPEFWVPLGFDASDMRPGQRGARNLRVIARLRPGASASMAHAEAVTLAARLAAEYPGTNRELGARVDPLLEVTVSAARPALLTLVGAVGLVLLIACANVANILLARAAGRRSELAVRASLGARRTRLVRQLLVESMLLALIGGWFGLLAASWAVGLVDTLQPGTLPRAGEIGVDWAAAAIGGTLVVLTTAMFGMLPALQATRLDLVTALKEDSRTAAPGQARTRRALVVAEVALAVVLLAGAGLLVRSFIKLQQVDPGFDPSSVITFTISLPDAAYPDSDRVIAFYERLEDEIGSVPGVHAAGFIFGLPLGGINGTSSFEIEGRSDRDEPTALIRAVGGRYFDALGIRVRNGRAFDDRDHARAAPVALVNAAAARMYWGGENPVGQRLRIHASFVSDHRFGLRDIVGLVDDVKHAGLDRDTRPEIYVPFHQQAIGVATIVVRGDGDPLALLPALRARVRAIDPALPLADVARMEDVVARSFSTRRFTASVLGFFAASAVLLAGIGVFGLVSYLVTQRRREIGIRLALGADASRIAGMIVRQFLVMTCTGVAIGIAASLVLAGAMRRLLFDIDPRDPITFAAVPVVLLASAALASYLPARRASRIHPAEALRAE